MFIKQRDGWVEAFATVSVLAKSMPDRQPRKPSRHAG